MRPRHGLTTGAAVAALALLAACTPTPSTPATGDDAATGASSTRQEAVVAQGTPAPAPSAGVEVVPANPYERPAWLHTVPLEVTENGLAEPVDTPEELRDRRLEPRPGAHPDPESDDWFVEITDVPEDVLARSSWHDECPIAAEDLAYVVMPFWGFDEQPHTGEMVIAAEHAEAVAGVFALMYERRFPIEEMRVTTVDEVGGTHYGDLNVTIAFECRQVTGGFEAWSEHAKGVAIDINPFQNPFFRDGFVFPELASAYLDRSWLRPGMIETHMAIVAAFEEIGWSWGGSWDHLDDWMHFSASGL
ncbi:M15 family metallopeptidase [Demequina pelophila]|uniref:M15 family metallopeptidase n=1 Tax=Demequina pelophila TaxID=1638984 RepID=UPI000AE27BAE|nr:M15 family metallopeptidase [Demequina pelophila]